MRVLICGLFILVWGSQTSLEAATMTAKKDGVPILAQAKRDALVIRELKKGELLEASEREGMFWKIVMKDGNSAYVSALQVERKVDEDNGIQTALRKSALEARAAGDDDGKSARARSAVMGVRGLDESKDLASAGSVRPDYQAVYRMEDRIVSAKRLDKLNQELQAEIEKNLNKQNTEER